METKVTDIAVRAIDGTEMRLDAYLGKALLVVNVASQCGLTPQYAGLEALHARYQGRGFAVLAFPANEFGGQEPGTDPEILAFCKTTYGVHFPLFAKVVVKGPGQHPLYQRLTRAIPQAVQKPGGSLQAKLRERGLLGAEGEITWNFEKFLVDRAGTVVERFAPDVEPLDPLLTGALERLLEDRR